MSPNNFSKSENLMRCHDIVPWFRGMPFDMPRLLDQLEPRLPDLFSSDAVLPSLIYTGDRRCRSEEHTSELQSLTNLYTLSLHDALPISATTAPEKCRRTIFPSPRT